MKKHRFSKHAEKSLAKRNITVSDVNIALDKGTKIHRTGVIFYFLRKKDLPEGKEFEHLNGLTVLAKNRTIITVYRNRRILHEIKQKAKRNNRKNFQGYGKPSFNYCPFHPALAFCECHSDMGLDA